MHNPWKEYSQVNPQRENGHRRINSDIWKSLYCARIPGSVFQLIMYIIDQSWGYDEKEITIGVSDICKSTKLSRRSIMYSIKYAEAARLIVIDHGNTVDMKKNSYLFNKHYDTWLVPSADDVPSAEDEPSAEDVPRTSAKYVPRTSAKYVPSLGTHIKNRKQKVIYKDNNRLRKTDPARFL